MTDIATRLRRWVHAVDAVSASDLMDEAATEIELLRARMGILETAIRRLSEQDATLSVQGGNVTVTMNPALTDEEREAIKTAADFCATTCAPLPSSDQLLAIRDLLSRLS